MKRLTLKKALSLPYPHRTRDYKYKAGKFTLTASFRDQTISYADITLAGSLARVFTQREIADMLNVSVSIVGKMVRSYHARE